ncbi:MAG TPA: tellurite resistance/C4-dicarboxylate transporter family protein, partial [Enteractinococcus sp.]
MPETQDQQQPQTREPNISAPWWSPHDLTPGYFAIVIASGIISLACKLLNFTVASTVLLIIAAVAYILLVVLNIWRFIAYRSALIADFTNVRQSFGFFTFVAGTGVLGTGLAMAGWWTVASILLVIAAVAWLILGYVIPVVAVLGKTERPITQGANGLWFVLIVGAQSVAVLAATLEPVLDNVRNVLAITAV